MSNFKVYKYGLLAPIESNQLVRDQMFLAHKYRNTLTEIERGRRAAVRSIMRENDGNIRQLELNLSEAEALEKKISQEIKEQHSIMRSRISTQTDKEELKDARSNKKERKRLLIEARNSIKNNTILDEKLQVIKNKANDLIRNAREHCGVYWGTYLLIEDAMDAVRKMPMYDGSKDNDPDFVRLDLKKNHAVGIQLQGGLDVKDVFGTDTQCRIDAVDENAFYGEKRSDRRKNSRTILHLRVGSDPKKKPIWASFPMIMHRPLPENGVIKGVKVQVKRIGSREEWSAIFTIDVSNVLAMTSVATGMVAIDLGWRNIKDADGNTTHFRMGKWRDENGKIEEIKLDPMIISGIQKANELRSTRDDNFNTMRYKLAEWMKNNTSPLWLMEKAKTLSQWRSPAKLVSLVRFWSQNRFDGDANIFGISGQWDKTTKNLTKGVGLSGWRYHDSHLWEWECNQRRKSLLRRKEFYRITASQLANKYQTLVLEDFDLRKVSQTPEPDAKEDNQKARANKTLGAPSEFRLALSNAFNSRNGEILKIDPKGTSYIHATCGKYQKLDNDTAIQTCTECGETYDRDDNATENILRLGREQLGDAKNAVIARSDEKDNESTEIQETRYQRRNRAKQEKALRESVARKAEANAA